MVKNYLGYKEEMYEVRYINELCFGNKSLEELLLDEDEIPKDSEAERFDLLISSYLSDWDFDNLSDEDVWANYNNKPMIDVPIRTDILDEDMTVEFLDKWFNDSSPQFKNKFLELSGGEQWYSLSHLNKKMWFNTANQ